MLKNLIASFKNRFKCDYGVAWYLPSHRPNTAIYLFGNRNRLNTFAKLNPNNTAIMCMNKSYRTAEKSAHRFRTKDLRKYPTSRRRIMCADIFNFIAVERKRRGIC